MLRRSVRLSATLLACVALLLTGLLAGCSSKSGDAATPSASAAANAPGWAKGMATVAQDELPPEAREMLRLIDAGGPFRYDKDGATFGNYERVLPRQKRGYYREYTVRTPRERDRGARRIVTGKGGEFYYTDDHYETFKAVLR
ncbi:ribonuclease domain-containing protein [Streptomyces sp. T-3]|nr:ribonuclease domain-containing protein [Streptomyces sp. T-3]